MRVGVRCLATLSAIAVSTAIVFVLAGGSPAAAAQPPARSAASPQQRVRVHFQTYLHAHRRAIGIPRSPVRIRGTVTPYVAGQTVAVRIFRGTHRVLARNRPVAAAVAMGRFGLSFKPKHRGVFRVRVAAAATTAPPATPARARARLLVVRSSAGLGARGTQVRALQSRLAQLGYLTPVNGFFGASTARAVLAFNKVAGFSRTDYAGRAVFRRLARGGGGFKVRHPEAGKHAEFDWSRQVLVLARGAMPKIIVHASSGKPSTPTVFGKFHFYGRQPGTNSHGMYYSTYFVGGYAVHGYAEVPVFAASHGCIRIPIASAISVYRWLTIGTRMYVYR
jgi:hypothetical protein